MTESNTALSGFCSSSLAHILGAIILWGKILAPAYRPQICPEPLGTRLAQVLSYSRKMLIASGMCLDEGKVQHARATLWHQYLSCLVLPILVLLMVQKNAGKFNLEALLEFPLDILCMYVLLSPLPTP